MMPSSVMRKLWLTVAFALIPASIPVLVAAMGPSAAKPNAQAGKPAVLTIEADHALHAVSPMLYGMMTEEINFSYDGGLYAELVKNRTMRSKNFLDHDWLVVQNAAAGAAMELDKSTGPSEALNDSIKLTVKSASATEPAGIRNMGYWGYPLKPNTTYAFSVQAKADASIPLHINLISNKTGASVVGAEIDIIPSSWRQYTAKLKTGPIAASEDYHLELTLTQPGTVWLDLVSLFPPTYHDRPNGTRIDLMEKLAGLHPAFLRFPGGNYLEGDHITERFEWKKTIGPLVDRPTHPSPWNYHSSDGMGLLEFLEWCEDLKMQPVLAVYGGYSMKQEHVEPGKELEPYIRQGCYQG